MTKQFLYCAIPIIALFGYAVYGIFNDDTQYAQAPNLNKIEDLKEEFSIASSLLSVLKEANRDTIKQTQILAGLKARIEGEEIVLNEQPKIKKDSNILMFIFWFGLVLVLLFSGLLSSKLK